MALVNGRASASEQTEHQDKELARLQKRTATAEAELSEARAELAKREALDGGPSAFFVVGQSKSGTGWLMKILDSHPEILCRGGGRFFGRHLRDENLKGMQASEAVRAKIQPSSLHNALLNAEYLRLWIERSSWSRDEDPDEHLSSLTRLSVDYFLGRKLAKSGKRFVGDKTPLFDVDILSDIASLYPEAKAVHIIRDGRDVAVSQMHQLWKTARDLGGISDLEPHELAKREAFYWDPQAFLASREGIFSEGRLRRVAEEWQANVGKAIEDGPALLGEGYTEIKYERLLEEPKAEVRRLFGFLGSDASEKTVTRCVVSASFETRSGRERGRENYALDHGKHRKGIAGDWKNVFTERDKEIFKDAAGDLLIELGYERNGAW